MQSSGVLELAQSHLRWNIALVRIVLVVAHDL